MAIKKMKTSVTEPAIANVVDRMLMVCGLQYESVTPASGVEHLVILGIPVPILGTAIITTKE